MKYLSGTTPLLTRIFAKCFSVISGRLQLLWKSSYLWYFSFSVLTTGNENLQEIKKSKKRFLIFPPQFWKFEEM